MPLNVLCAGAAKAVLGAVAALSGEVMIDG